jgi:hypothetical protein
MIQRKQSLLLVLAALLLASTWFFPIASYSVGEGEATLRTTGLYNAQGEPDARREVRIPFALLHAVLAGALVFVVFLYKDRPRQVRFVRMTYLLMLAVIVLQFITENSTAAYIELQGGGEGRYGASFFLPIGALVLAHLAERSIRADEALVRSVDRLR